MEVMQPAKFLNGAFVVAWHLVGFLVNTVAQALHVFRGIDYLSECLG